MSNQRVFARRLSSLIIPGIMPVLALACGGAHFADVPSTGSPDSSATQQEQDDSGTPVILPVGVNAEAESGVADSTTPDDGGAVSDAASEAASEAAPPEAASCLAPSMVCDAGCVANDVNNCGACGTICPAPANATATCVEASATYSCGWTCNANSTLCGGACLTLASLKTDASNCGSCGHVCLPGACGGGYCQEWSVARDNLLISGGDPSGARVAMATDGTNVAWLDGYGQAFEVPVASGNVVALSPAPAANVKPGAIAIANGIVAWTLSDPTLGISVWTAASNVANSGTRLNQLGDSSQVPGGLALNAGGTAAYFVEDSSSNANVYELNLGTSAYFTSLTSSAPGGVYDDVAATRDYLFWTESVNGTVMRYTLANGAVTTIASGQGTPYRLAVDATNVYWASAGANSTFTIAWTSQTAPAAPTVIPTVAGSALGLAADGANVYFTAITAGSYELASVGIGGGTPTQLQTTSDGLFGVMVGGGTLFWFSTGGDVIFGKRL